MTADAQLVAQWDAPACRDGVRRLFGLADDLDRAYQRADSTVTDLVDWRGAAADRALARLRTAVLQVSRLAGLLRQAADAIRLGLPGIAEAAHLAAAPPQYPAEAAQFAAVASSVDDRVATGLAGVRPEAHPRPRTAEPPPAGLAPADVARWWIDLPPDLRRQLSERRPDLLGGLAGLPADVRDQANRRRLTALRRRLQSERDQLQSRLPGIPPPLVRQAVVRSMLTIAEAVDRTLATLAGHRPPARLLTLELGGMGRVAIAVGDIDNADHVAVLVPGMGQDAGHGVPGTVQRAADLHAEAGRQSLQSTAVVAWLGYAAPGWRDVPFPTRARTGGRMLTADLASYAAGRTGEPAHVTLVGHSYGSTVVGATMLAGPRRADDVVLLGSPGVLAGSAHGLGLNGHHVYVGEAPFDPVADLGAFGRDPGDPEFGATRIRADGPPGVPWGDYLLTAHAHYFDPGSESLRNVARIIVGRGSDATRPGVPA